MSDAVTCASLTVIFVSLSLLVSGGSGQFSSEISHQAEQEEETQNSMETTSGQKPRSDTHLLSNIH